MPRGYRCVVLACVGWLTLAASPPRHGTDNEQADSQPAIAKSLATIADAATKSVQPIPSAEHDRPCNASEQDRKSELCAEWQAADQAKEASRWAARSFWVGFAGIIGLLASLYYTRKAVKIADDATKDADNALAIAKRNADAATAQVEVAREIAQRELRAYVDFEEVRLVREKQRDTEERDWAGVHVKLRNFGRTPAENVKIVSAYGKWRAPGIISGLGNNTKTDLGGITPTDCLVWNDFFGFEKPLLETMRQDQWKLHVEITVTYTDVFGSPHVLKAVYQTNGRDDDLGFMPGSRQNT